MSTSNLPDISHLNADELLEHQAAVNARVDDMKREAQVRAERFGLTVTNGTEKKRRGRKPKAETQE
jgi:hypothetical protein